MHSFIIFRVSRFLLLTRLLALKALYQSKLLNWLPRPEGIITSCLGLRCYTAAPRPATYSPLRPPPTPHLLR